jgi:hypothetical protein
MYNLNNPKTMDLDHVIRALNIRHLDNNNDIVLMFYLSLLTVFIIGCGFQILAYRSFKWKSLIVIVPVFFFLFYKIIAGFNEFEASYFNTLPVPKYSLIYFFYICDGIVIILSYSFNQSYEAMNLWLFFFLQPIIIISLFISVYRLQSKLKKHI